MLLVLYIVTILFLLFVKKTNKNTWVIAALLISLLSITSNFYADLDNYVPLFNYYNSKEFVLSFPNTNFIWVLLCKLFYMLGFNYRGMIIGIVFFNYYLLHRAAKNLQCNENIFFGLFLIFPSIIQLINLKFSLAFSLIVFAYSILCVEKKYSTICFFILTIIASLIHNSAFVFLLLIFAKKKKINMGRLFVIALIITVFIIFNLNTITHFVQHFISNQQYERYFTDTITPSSNIWILLIFLCWLISYIFGFLAINYINKDKENKYNNIFRKCIVVINIMVLTLPLLLLDRNMHRFIEIGFVMVFFMMSMILKGKFTKNKMMLLFCMIISLITVMAIYTPYDSVLDPIFTYDEIVDIRR